MGNKRSIGLVFFLLVGLSVAQAQSDEDLQKQIVRARLIIEGGHVPVIYARVLNKSRETGVFTDSLGNFSIHAQRNDTLYITSMGFFPREIVVKDSLFKKLWIPEISLKERVYELEKVEINPLGTYDQFKYNVLHLNLPPDEMQNVIASIQKGLSTIPHRPLKPEASIPLGSPITALYLMFSKEGRSIRKYNETIAQEKVLHVVYEKYNREVVARVTGLSGERLNQFMLYCPPDNDFILLANEYDVCKKIAECYESFERDVLRNENE